MGLSNIDWGGLLALITTQLTSWGLKVLGALFIFWIGKRLARWARSLVRKLLTKGEVDPTLIPFVSGMAYYALMGAVVIAALTTAGINTTSAIAVLGAAGLAVGLALQGTLSNFAAGVMLLIFRPFRVGDFVDAGGHSGSVQAIRLFATVMNTGDNVQIIIPNSAIFGGTIKNFATNDTRRNDIVVGISYDDDIQLAVSTIRGILEADSRVLKDPEPLVAVSELGDSSINLVVRPWCKREDYWALRFDLLETFKEKIEAAGCSFPFPQSDVHLFQKTGT
jgi:small conductance mechanosensitive channel